MPTEIRNQNVQSRAGAFAQTQQTCKAMEILVDSKKNFLDNEIDIVEGLKFNHYETLKRIHYYLNSKYIGGDTDENGDERFFHNISLHRCAHATKNIDLDTKDLLVYTDKENDYWRTMLLRMDLRQWMKKHNFAKLLNKMADELPQIGGVIWKKEKDEDGRVFPVSVDWRDVIADPSADDLKDSQIVMFRSRMKPYQLRKNKLWDKDAVEEAIKANQGNTKKDPYISKGQTGPSATYSTTEDTPDIDVYEVWGWLPETAIDGEGDIKISDPDPLKFKYVMMVVTGLDETSTSKTLYATEADPEDFPVKACYYRKKVGRLFPVGNVELTFDLQVRANELVNRVFKGLRMGTLHLFQTKGSAHYTNLMQDAQDGDIVETTHEITPIATEIRAFSQYQVELENINRQADGICNTSEVVTGESMPAATPFRLSAQLGASAQKFFNQVKENEGIFLSEVFNEWILPDLVENLTKEHAIELIGSLEELKIFDDAYRKSKILKFTKDFVLAKSYLPTSDEIGEVEKLIGEQMQMDKRQVKIEQDWFGDLSKMRVEFSVTDENNNKEAEQATWSNLLQIITSNPAVMQDPKAKMIIGKIMELNGVPALQLLGDVTKQEDPNAMAQAASPAATKFSQNPGDASSNTQLGQESVAAGIEAKAK